MQASKLIWKIGGVTLGVMGGLLILSNPGQHAYEDYATTTLVTYVKEDVCSKATPEGIEFITSHCKSLVDVSRPQIEEVISNKTQRQNFWLFSIYETDLSFFEPLPSYRFHTLGLFQQFYVYNQEEL
ncbi:DUF4359 domain-containing protein [Gloeocapsa sp. PCC 73106]|uniref:DUF4359 domain-containing protein n=1 Tax=Gloeocapsa sp. PCC 73106 TaxID=102232 RepID=UPI0002ACD819|nr:DUF4359 domain-containing protein [Gloeocapsa sp. PCC 73106]ELR97758.1 hypothetical protein GLO73106DRAFT_00015730 [Gloeocapsa sp. PCC 73106]